MNLHANVKYPLLKYLSEEFQGSFFQNKLTCLNRMLILYHNRYSFSIDDSTGNYLDDFESYLQRSLKLSKTTAQSSSRYPFLNVCKQLCNGTTVFLESYMFSLIAICNYI